MAPSAGEAKKLRPMAREQKNTLGEMRSSGGPRRPLCNVVRVVLSRAQSVGPITVGSLI